MRRTVAHSGAIQNEVKKTIDIAEQWRIVFLLPTEGAIMRKLLLLIGPLVLSCVSLAQSNQTSWSKLSSLQPGQVIQVADTAAKAHSGTFVSVSDTAIVLRNKSSEQSIQEADVRSVKLVKGTSLRARNIALMAAIGGGVGAGIGVVSKAACGNKGLLCDTSPGKWAGIGAVFGVIIGAVIGAVMPSHSSTTIYKASSQHGNPVPLQ
jgi:hypothetical protein